MSAQQNIQDFYTQAVAKDFARQFQFRIGTWSVADTPAGSFGLNDLVYLETATLPGRAINNIPVPFMGLNFNVPGTASYPGSDAWAVTFRCDSNYSLRNALETMSEQTFSVDTSQGNYGIKGTTSTLTLNLLGKDMNAKRVYKLVGVYLVSIGDTSYNLGDNGTVQTIPATLAYQYWTSPSVKPA
jgi:hypothetical protein